MRALEELKKKREKMKKKYKCYPIILLILLFSSSIFAQEVKIKLDKNTVEPGEKINIKIILTNTSPKKMIIPDYINPYENVRFYSMNNEHILHRINCEIYLQSSNEIVLNPGESHVYKLTYVYKHVDNEIRLYLSKNVFLELYENFHIKFKVKYFADMGWLTKYIIDEVIDENKKNEYIYRDSVFSNEVEIQFLKDS